MGRDSALKFAIVIMLSVSALSTVLIFLIAYSYRNEIASILAKNGPFLFPTHRHDGPKSDKPADIDYYYMRKLPYAQPSDLEKFVAHGWRINEPVAEYRMGNTPLIVALLPRSRGGFFYDATRDRERLYGVICEMVRLGADVRQPDGYGFEPIYYAKLNDDGRLAELLVEHGATEPDDDEMLRFVVLTRPADELKLYFKRHHRDLLDALYAPDADGRTPAMLLLVSAAKSFVDGNVRYGGCCDKEKLCMVLEAGQDLNAADRYGFTPLMYAVSLDRDCAELLIEYSAVNMGRTTPRGTTALDLVNFYRPSGINMLRHTTIRLEEAGCGPGPDPDFHIGLADGLLAREEGIVPPELMKVTINALTARLAESGDSERLRALLDMYGGLDDEFLTGPSPYKAAAENDRPECLRILFEHEKRRKGFVKSIAASAFDMAVEKGNMDCAAILAENGGSENLTGIRMEKVTKGVMENGSMEGFEMLLDMGLDVNAPIYKGSPPIFYAAAYGQTGLVLRLLEEGVNPDTGKEKGRTPIMAAADNGHWDTVEALAPRALYMDFGNHQGKTVLILAAEAASWHTVKVLVENGADINAKDRYGNTAYRLARQHRARDVAEYLLEKGANGR